MCITAVCYQLRLKWEQLKLMQLNVQNVHAALPADLQPLSSKLIGTNQARSQQSSINNAALIN